MLMITEGIDPDVQVMEDFTKTLKPILFRRGMPRHWHVENQVQELTLVVHELRAE